MMLLNANMENLPARCCVIMVHKLFSERVRVFVGVTCIPELLHITESTGRSHQRRGYQLLLLDHTPCGSSCINPTMKYPLLPPMARQNIAWVGTVQKKIANMCDLEKKIGTYIWNETVSILDWKSMKLRVDCYPKALTEHVCLQLQQQAAIHSDTDEHITIDDPFDGPLSMTLSSSKCTHRLTVIQTRSDQNMNEDTAGCYNNYSYFWGIMSRPHDNAIMDLRLNHIATEELQITPANNITMTDLLPNTDPALPLSRAYFKLHQVWQEHLLQYVWLRGSAGLDLGASPGGWTQVLVHCVGLSHVLALDAGRLADRVTNLPQVHHVSSTMEHFAAYQQQQQSKLSEQCQKYSIFVCDASVHWNEVLDLLVEVARTIQWTVPAVAVVTMKLPFKTVGSIRRNVELMRECLPQRLEHLCQAMYSKEGLSCLYRFELAHLMANTDQERTLIVSFWRKAS